MKKKIIAFTLLCFMSIAIVSSAYAASIPDRRHHHHHHDHHHHPHHPHVN